MITPQDESAGFDGSYTGAMTITGASNLNGFTIVTKPDNNTHAGVGLSSLQSQNWAVTNTQNWGRPTISLSWASDGDNTHNYAYAFGQGGVNGVSGSSQILGLGRADTGAYGWIPKYFFTNDGKMGIGDNNPAAALAVTGNIRYTGNIAQSSDDRLKHNEVNVTNATDKIKQLVAKTYYKTENMYASDHNFSTFDIDGNPTEIDENGDTVPVEQFVETGFIAQDVEQIPELAYCVHKDDVKPWAVNYNNLFVLAIQSIKELEARIYALENPV